MIRRARALVVGAYDLKPPNRSLTSISNVRATEVAFIKDRVASLLDEDFTFMRGEFGTCKNGQPRANVPFAHPAIADLIWVGCYSTLSRQDRAAYDPMPLPLIALAATVLYAALSSWSDGYFVLKAFSGETYAPSYRVLYKTAVEFRDSCPHRCRALIASYSLAMQ